MGTPIWGDSPPLVYFAEPIDKASGQNFAIAAAMHNTLTTWGCGIYRPRAAFRATTPDPRVEQINRHALYQADVIVAYLSETTPSIGVPAEIEAATSRGIPAVVHYTGESFVLAGNPLVTVIDDPNSLVGAVEHTMREHPRREVHYTEGGWCHTCGGVGLDRYEHRERLLTATKPVRQCTHGADCPIHPNARTLHNYGQTPDPNWWDQARTTLALYLAGQETVGTAAQPEPIRLVITEGAQPPARAYADDAGLDLSTAREVTIQPGEYKDIHTQVEASQLPNGYWGLITGRSSALRKWRLHIPPSIIDPGWRGPLFVGVWNLGGNPVTVKPGDRLGQLILIPNNPAPVQVVPTVDDHPRGLNGFGSSGV